MLKPSRQAYTQTSAIPPSLRTLRSEQRLTFTVLNMLIQMLFVIENSGSKHERQLLRQEEIIDPCTTEGSAAMQPSTVG